MKLKCPVCQAGFSVQRKLTKHIKVCTLPAPPQLGDGQPLQDSDQPALVGEQALLVDVQPVLQIPSSSGDQATSYCPAELISDETDYGIILDIDLPFDLDANKIPDIASIDDFLDIDFDFGSI